MKNKFASLALLVIIALFIWFCSEYWYQLVIVHGNSMAPTYKSGQFLLIKKYNNNYEIGDVIVFWNPEHDMILIKRIEACEGEHVLIDEKPYKLLEHEYYVLGDNRNESIDSRSKKIGIVKENQIIGIVINGDRKNASNNFSGWNGKKT